VAAARQAWRLVPPVRVYGPLVAEERVARCPKGLPDFWQQKPPPNGAVRLPPESTRCVQQDILAMVTAQGDRVARGLTVSALAVTPTTVQLGTATPEEGLWQGMERLKSKLAWRRNTWGRGILAHPVAG
jgi:hypothetical protein